MANKGEETIQRLVFMTGLCCNGRPAPNLPRQADRLVFPSLDLHGDDMRKFLLAFLCLSVSAAGAFAEDSPRVKKPVVASRAEPPGAKSSHSATDMFLVPDGTNAIYDRGNAIAKRAIGSMCTACTGRSDNRPGPKTSLIPSDERPDTTVDPRMEGITE